MENIARKYGVSKSDFLDREADDLAVRIALGETNVISDTKKALVNAGVNISALENFASGKTDGAKRSNHVVLVKNLPYGSSEGDLMKMFGKFGSLEKIILPSTKTLALVCTQYVDLFWPMIASICTHLKFDVNTYTCDFDDFNFELHRFQSF